MKISDKKSGRKLEVIPIEIPGQILAEILKKKNPGKITVENPDENSR